MSRIPPGPARRYFSPSLLLLPDPLRFLQQLAATYGDVVRFKMGLKTLILVNRPELFHDIFVTNAAKFEKGVAGPLVRLLLGDGLLTSQGADHRRQRRLVQPAFHRARLEGYARVISAQAESVTSSWQDLQIIDVAKEMSHLTMRIISRVLFSAELDAEADSIDAAIEVFLSNMGRLQFPAAGLLLRWPTPFRRRLRDAQSALDELIYRLIRNRRAEGVDHGDLLSMLLMAEDAEHPGERLSDVEVRDQCMTVFMAGHETAGHALAWILWLLATHPDADAQLQSELSRILGGREPELTDVPKLVRTESTVREAMRLFPPAWAVSRLATTEAHVGEYLIEPGTIVLMSQWVTHRDERFYENAQNFLPERWTPDFRERLHKYAYFPFGGGPRTCIGEHFAWLELVLLVARIAQRWRFTCIEATRAEPLPRVTLRPRGQLLLQATRRASPLS